MHYLLAGALALALFIFLFAWRERRLRERRTLLQQILDLADAFERQLIDCRNQMRAMPQRGGNDPAEALPQPVALAAATAMIDSGLRDLLAHRLWLRRESARAPLQALIAARDALAQAQSGLQAQMARLADARAELRNARDALDAAARSRQS